MKLIHVFSLSFLFLSVSVIFGQSNAGYFNFIESTVNNLNNAIRVNNSSSVVELSTIDGSPYENELFSLGKAINKLSKKSNPYYLRYNIYNDVIEIDDSKSIYGLIKSLNIYAIINNQEYHYEIYSVDNSSTDEGYFILLSKGTNCNLYLKKIKKLKEKVESKDSYHKETPASFVDLKSYFIKKDRILLPISKKKKEFLLQFPEKENELKKYMKAEKINLKSEKDVVKLFTYYDSLLK